TTKTLVISMYSYQIIPKQYAMQDVEKEHAQSNHQPSEKPKPGQNRDATHQQHAEEHTEHGGKDSTRSAKTAVAARITIAKDNHTNRYQDEGEKRADIG